MTAHTRRHCTAPEGSKRLTPTQAARLVTGHEVTLTQTGPTTWSFTCSCGFVCDAVREAGFKALGNGGSGA